MATGWYVIDPPDTGVLQAFTQKVNAAMSGQLPIAGTMFSPQIPKLAAAMIGLVSPAGGFATTLPKVTASIAGAQQQSGAEASTLKQVTMAMMAFQVLGGPIAPVLHKVSGALLGGVFQSGAIATTLKAASAAMSGEQDQIGTVASTLPRVSASMVQGGTTGDVAATLPKTTATILGEQDQIGTVTSILPKLTAAMLGEQDQVGAMGSTLGKVSAATAGYMQPSGAMASTLPKHVAALIGSHAQSGTMGPQLRKVTAAVAGSQKTPVAFDVAATGPSSSSGFIGPIGNSWTHTVTTGLLNVALIVIFDVRYGGQTQASQTTQTVTIGGVQMTFLGRAQVNSENSVEMWGALNVGTGAKSMNLAYGNGTFTGRAIAAESFSYANVASFGTAVTNTGTGTTGTASFATATSNDVVLCAYGAVSQSITAVTQTARMAAYGSPDAFAQLRAADAVGASPTAFSSTIASSTAWGTVADILVAA